MQMRSDNDFYVKLKATLLTALILIWCLFFARYITWDADVYEKDPEQDLLMEVDLGDLDQALLGDDVGSSAVKKANLESSVANFEKEESEQINQSGEVKINHSPKPINHKSEIKKKNPKQTISHSNPPTNLSITKPKEPIISNKIAPPPVPKAILNNKFVKTEVAKSPGPVFSRGNTQEKVSGAQGRINGRENAKPLFGNNAAGGISVAQNLRNRGIIQLPKFNEKFNENASFRVEIKVSKEGKCSFLRVMRTNSSSANLLRIIRQKITELRFKPGHQEDVGYIDFVFKVVQ